MPAHLLYSNLLLGGDVEIVALPRSTNRLLPLLHLSSASFRQCLLQVIQY